MLGIPVKVDIIPMGGVSTFAIRDMGDEGRDAARNYQLLATLEAGG